MAAQTAETSAPGLGGPEPPGPRGRPIVGNLPELQNHPLAFLLESRHRYGDVVRFRVPFVRLYFVAHPDHVQHVLQERHRIYSKNNFDYKTLKRAAGEGLLTSEGALWLRERRLMAPVFHKQKIAALGALMTEVTLDMLERWRPLEERGEPFDVSHEMMRLTLRIVGKALFGAEVGAADTETVGRNFTVVNELLSKPTILATFLPWVPTPSNLRLKRAVRALDQVVWRIIRERRQRQIDTDDLLSMLLAARDAETGEGMNDRQLRDEVITLLLAGSETTANALSWVWLMLSENADVDRRLCEELRSVLGGRPPAAEDVANLPYTRRVVDETMRLYPPAWAVSRAAEEDDAIGGYPIPKGSTVLVSSYVTQRHAAFWQDPERFDPERFSPERSAGRHRFAYFPFGGGPRLCIGNNFALTEAVLVLATVAQRYRVKLVPGHPVALQPLITLRPRHGLRVTLEAR